MIDCKNGIKLYYHRCSGGFKPWVVNLIYLVLQTLISKKNVENEENEVDIVFLRYAVSAIMVYFSKYLTYSTSNVQLSEEPIEWPNYADKKSAQLKAINSK